MLTVSVPTLDELRAGQQLHQSSGEIHRLQATVRELRQEIAKWRLLAETGTGQGYDGGGQSASPADAMEATINRLLEASYGGEAWRR